MPDKDQSSTELPPNGEESLSPEDQERVRRYLSSPIHSKEKKPFRPWLMMLGLVVVVSSLSLLSILIAGLVLE